MTEAAAAAAIAAILVLLKLVMPFLVAVTMMASAVPIAVIAGSVSYTHLTLPTIRLV